MSSQRHRVPEPGGHLIGVDVGGTKVSVGSICNGRFEGPHVTATDTSTGAALIDLIVHQVNSARSAHTTGVGLGVPSVVEFASGRVKSSVNVPLRDLPLRDLLGDRLGLPVVVDNDATCAALAEAHDGERLVAQNLVMFTVGTGVGGGLVLNGRVFRGSTGAAAELGHTLIGADLASGAPVTGSFPQTGSLEALASGRTLDALATAAGRADPNSRLGRLVASGADHLGREAVAAAEDDADSARLVELVGERLGVGIANAINVFDPDVVVIGGGMAVAGELLLEPARRTAARFVLPGVGERTEVRLARYGAEAGVRGAALLARQELEVQPSSGSY